MRVVLPRILTKLVIPRLPRVRIARIWLTLVKDLSGFEPWTYGRSVVGNQTLDPR